ncbi:MAG: 23S rRNA pseudouridine(2605) synthase RluB [Acidithiobacillus ferriphilus]|jgi:ribosomal large subunit pseudouridine synthase B (EC 5.4.99.-)|uniref:23S rRNA pseudouridine(2605) synthase RluB n=1 Tax=Acidithiobacillus TaxID=119977 RepID=UPI001C06443F|nr:MULTISPECIES: pseudouridine synthase [Acidithiobacillus]MBU2784605.1 pseudouridine synthase [Acidithiobacillus ferriphilus]MBU2827738.1 pseudouridine synthase [Acidithiobacillus ferriphilus]MBU2844585.1 pseudouridine synthase [Acidithiobacillus ferriphilus]MBU2848297.1 pseudouridine synthase [Acidithiobacillus ferriphilus]MDA8246553.1 pseudouridine synthase [Acidithiobacillus sp.]
MDEKLQKVLARFGLGSRRLMEEWIAAGRVVVNGQPAKLGDRVTAQDKIAVDGAVLRIPSWVRPRLRVLRYHKPAGELTTRSDPEGRPTVFDRLPRLRGSRWITIGRLDFNTEGLLLLTNDGDLANALMHPRAGIEREYAVRVMGVVSPEQQASLLQGVPLEDGEARFATLQETGGEGLNRWYHVTLTEGRNREVRRLFEAVGLTVSRLIRVRYGVVEMPRLLKTGYFDELSDEEREALLASVQWVNPATPPSDQAERGTEASEPRKNNSRREARQGAPRGRTGQGRRVVRG